MNVNKPQYISLAEWREIMQVQEVNESWGLSDETPEEFAASVYAVKFDFVSGSQVLATSVISTSYKATF